MNLKYQIFVSSTYEDLREEREQVVKVILEMGHIPVGMEMFSAADEEQWKIIARQIEECDYYVVIIAHRYGSLDDAISFTEKEYDYAIRYRVPVFGFIIDETASWPANRIDGEPDKKEALEQFKEKVKRKIVSFWNSAEDLYGKVAIALMKAINTNPRPGWVRANKIAGPEVTAELTRLSAENSELRLQLEAARTEATLKEDEELDQLVRVLKKNNIIVKFMYYSFTKWSDPTEISLYRIFNLLAPELMIVKSTAKISSYIGSMMNPQKRKLRDTFPVPTNSLNKLLADLFILGLVVPSSQGHEIGDTNEYWSLSDKGREAYSYIRLQRLRAGLEAEDIQPDSPNPSDVS